MSTALTIKTIFGVVIAGILILFVLLPLGVMLYKIFNNGEDQGTLESLSRLETAITQIKDTQDVAIYIKKGFSIVGFERDKGTVIDTCGWKHSTLLKPPVCGSDACICICEEKSCANAQKCIPLKDVKCFSSVKHPPNYGGTGCNGNQLVLLGCGFQKFGVRKLALTKDGEIIKIDVSSQTLEEMDSPMSVDTN